jgi:hypothetical protein
MALYADSIAVISHCERFPIRFLDLEMAIVVYREIAAEAIELLRQYELQNRGQQRTIESLRDELRRYTSKQVDAEAA